MTPEKRQITDTELTLRFNLNLFKLHYPSLTIPTEEANSSATCSKITRHGVSSTRAHSHSASGSLGSTSRAV